jgi:hypothetical protein
VADDPPPPRDSEPAPAIFGGAAALVLAGIGAGTWAAAQWWEDERRFHASFVLYVSLFTFWIVIPSIVAFFGKDVPFPTLFRSVLNLEDWLRSRPWRIRQRPIGPILAWLVTYVILAGLAILLLHLTLYPFPDNTHILNPDG